MKTYPGEHESGLWLRSLVDMGPLLFTWTTRQSMWQQQRA